MKNPTFSLTLIALAGFCSIQTLASDPHILNTIVDVVPQNTFIPPGFDSNDRAQIVVEGYYPGVLALAIVAIISLGYTASMGGKIRHVEFNSDSSSVRKDSSED